MEIHLEEVEALLKIMPEAISVFRAAVNAKDYALTAQWYDLETCHKLRGAGAYSTFKNNRWYQPKGGIPDAIVQGRHVWSRETVAEWVQLTDAMLPDYHKKYKTGARSPRGDK